ncbi:Glyoxalase/Bleomycin resistance protein/Dihydroxybiphenyl dioxygenase, partial [Periconia macrospinosa]
GTDAPADIRTLGYFINHLSLNVNNLTRSIEFYTSVFGMRHMFTYHLTPRLSFTYLTHSAGGRNGTGYQTTQELIRDKNNAAGAIELVHFSPRDKKDIEGPKTRTGTFSHVGIIVPNPKATQERLKEFGVRIYKEVGAEMPTEGPLSNPFYLGDATNLSEEEFEEIRVGMGKLNMLNIFAEDPDGNLLEIQPAD